MLEGADAVPASASKPPLRRSEHSSVVLSKAPRPPRPGLRTSPPSGSSGKLPTPPADKVCKCEARPWYSLCTVRHWALIVQWSCQGFAAWCMIV